MPNGCRRWTLARLAGMGGEASSGIGGLRKDGSCFCSGCGVGSGGGVVGRG